MNSMPYGALTPSYTSTIYFTASYGLMLFHRAARILHFFLIILRSRFSGGFLFSCSCLCLVLSMVISV